MKKRLFSLMLAAAMILTMLPVNVLAESTYQVVTVDKTEVEIGEEVHVQVTLPEGIETAGSFTVQLGFNNDVFEVTNRAKPPTVTFTDDWGDEISQTLTANTAVQAQASGMLTANTSYSLNTLQVAGLTVIDATLVAKQAGELDLEFLIFEITKSVNNGKEELTEYIVKKSDLAAVPEVTAVAPAVATGGISGWVSGLEYGATANVEVWKNGTTLITSTTVDAYNNSFSVSELEPGVTYMIYANADGYVGSKAKAVVIAGEMIEVEVHLEKIVSYYIKGSVSGITADDSVCVELWENGALRAHQYLSTTNDTYKFTDLQPGTYVVKATCNGYADYETTLVITDDDVYNDIAMTKKEVVDYLSMLQAEGSDVTIQNGLNTEVTVTLEATGDMELYGIEGYWDVEELDGEGFLTLKEIDSEVLTFDGVNTNMGYVVWTDDNFDGISLTKGTEVLTATYIVNGDMPAGTYTVRYRSVSLTGNDFKPNTTEIYYEAEIDVTRVGDPIPTTEITGSVSGIEDENVDVTISLYKVGETEDDATVTVTGNGDYTFTKVLPGEYTIKATANGYEDYTSDSFTVGTSVVEQDILMVKKEDKPPVADGYLGMLETNDTEVVVYAGEDTEVSVVLSANNTMNLMAIEGYWDVYEVTEEEQKYLTLSAIESDVLTFIPNNADKFVNVSNGYALWSDDNFMGVGLNDGTTVMTATYAVAGDTPAGEYTVRFRSEVLTGDDYTPNTTVTYYTATITVKHHTHVPGEAKEENRTEATCEAAGSYDSVIYCSDSECGMELSRTGKTIEKLGHNWSETDYDFAVDGHSCLATRICANDKTHTEVAVAEVTCEITVAANCTTMGTTTYTATFDAEYAEWTVTQTKDVVDVPVDENNHTFTEAGNEKQIVCERCEETNETAKLTVTTMGVTTEKCKVTYTSDSRVITVTNNLACKVGYLKDGIWTAIAAEFVSEDTEDGTQTYKFAVPSTEDDIGVVTDILIVVKGDVNGDNLVNSADKTFVARTMLLTTNPNHPAKYDMPMKERFAADINNDSLINSADKTFIARAMMAVTNPNHPAALKLSW